MGHILLGSVPQDIQHAFKATERGGQAGKSLESKVQWNAYGGKAANAYLAVSAGWGRELPKL